MQNQNEIIVITAAGGKTWLKERFMPSSWTRMFGEGLIGDYAKKMDTLRDVDDRIHEWTKDLGQLTREMRQALRGNRFIDVAILLGQLNKKLKNVHEAGKDVKKIEESALKDFERKHDLDIPDDILGTENSGLTTEAGFLSDLKRKWIAKKFENAHKQKRKLALNSLVDRAERLAKSVKSHVNNLGTARAAGDIGRYVDYLKQISLEQKEFQSMFVPIYNLYLKPVVDEAIRDREAQKLEQEEFLKKNKSEEDARLAELGLGAPSEVSEEKAPEGEMGPVIRVKPPVGLGERLAPAEPEAPEVGGESETVPASTPVLPVQHNPSAFTMHGPTEHRPEAFQGMAPPTAAPELSLPPVNVVEEKKKRTSKKKAPAAPPETTADFEMEQIIVKHNHANFVMELLKAAEQDDPYLLAAMLSKYAEQIEDVDLQKSLELLAISEGILDA